MGNAESTVDADLEKPTKADEIASIPDSECPVSPSKRQAVYNVYNQRIDEGMSVFDTSIPDPGLHVAPAIVTSCKLLFA